MGVVKSQELKWQSSELVCRGKRIAIIGPKTLTAYPESYPLQRSSYLLTEVHSGLDTNDTKSRESDIPKIRGMCTLPVLLKPPSTGTRAPCRPSCGAT